MRHDAKGSTSCNAPSPTFGARRAATFWILLAVSIGFLVSATGSATAATVNTHVFSSSFDGTGTVPIGSFANVSQVATHHASGRVYVIDAGHNAVAQFDASGTPLEFSSSQLPPGSTALTGSNTPQGSFSFYTDVNEFASPEPDIAVDNSGGPTDGRIYVVSESYRVLAFAPSGEYLFQIQRKEEFGLIYTATSDASGHLWTGASAGAMPFIHTEFGTAGTPPSPIGGFSSVAEQVSTFDFAFDSTDQLFAVSLYSDQSLKTRVDRYSPDGDFEATVDADLASAVAIDPSTDSVLVAGDGEIREHDDQGPRDTFGVSELGTANGIAGALNGNVYVADAEKNQVAIFEPGTTTAPDASIDPPSEIETKSATFTGTVNPLGFPTSYRFEYRFLGSSESWQQTPAQDAGNGTSDVPALAEVEGLEVGSQYEVRLVATDTERKVSFRTPVEAFTTDPVPPVVETVGWPYRTSTSVNLAARINPRNTETSYYFEYGTTSGYGSKLPASENGDAGAGGLSRLVLEELTGLAPDTTIHYRIVASNTAGTVTGEDWIVTTRSTDEIGDHGRLPGPPESDRAYEQVNIPNTNGNPVGAFSAASSDGNRVLYTISGGTELAETGSQSPYIAERTDSGWISTSIQPPRKDADVTFTLYPGVNSDLSKVVNYGTDRPGDVTFWELTPGMGPRSFGDVFSGGLGGLWALSSSRDLSTVLMSDGGHLYELTDTGREIVDLLPDGSPSLCGPGNGALPWGWHAGSYVFVSWPERHQIAADGSHMVFNTSPGSECGEDAIQLYIRHAGETGSLIDGETELISGPPLSGPDWPALFVSATPGDEGDPNPRIFFLTKSQLSPEDEIEAGPVPSSPFVDPRGADLYSYAVNSGEVDCLTCVVPHADVIAASSAGHLDTYRSIAVARDGSKIFFSSSNAFIDGQGTIGAANIYRYDVASDELAYVATTTEPGESLESSVGIDPTNGEALNEDGSVLVFRSAAQSLNQLSDSDNGGVSQYYRYDDRDRSLVCVSCPPNGAAVQSVPLIMSSENVREPRVTPLSADGDVYFATPESLLPVDQNTAGPGQSPDSGTDIYEWRDGRVMLVTDGITSHAKGQQPAVMGSSTSGRDVYFTATARLTADVTDGFAKLFDARIGGGFDFPPPPPPCSLDVCQGEAKGVPDDPTSGSSRFIGPGNPKPKLKKRRKARCRAKPRGGTKQRSSRRCQKSSRSRNNDASKRG